jgi:ABC-type lipoprotein export system ATPase subunit
MKISEIEVKDYQQFRDFKLDLTYPAGHPKAGQPLDKVCFIGQSGTGKTTLLNIMREVMQHRVASISEKTFVLKDSLRAQNNYKYLFAVTLSYGQPGLEKVHKSRSESTTQGKFVSGFFPDDVQVLSGAFENYEKIAHVYLYFNAELLDRKNDFIANGNIDPKIYISEDKASKAILAKEKELFLEKKFYDFSIDSPIEIWKQILHSAREYMMGALDHTRELTKRIINDIASSQAYIKEIENWRKKNPNPFEALASKANPFLHRFNLELKLNIDYDNPEDMKFLLVQPRDRHSEKLDYRTWSTGTKQVVMTATPLFALDTTDTVILFDEPERSLFPDVQRELVRFYTGLAPKAQFFFATHSPIIAAQFEPCERFVLSFNEEGYVQARPGRAPEGDDPNDVLTQDFMLRELLGDAGLEKRNEFLELKAKVKQEKDQAKKDELLKKLFALQAEYNF